MAKKKVKKQAPTRSGQHVVTNTQSPTWSDQHEVAELLDLSDPDEFRRAFLASEILNRKY